MSIRSILFASLPIMAVVSSISAIEVSSADKTAIELVFNPDGAIGKSSLHSSSFRFPDGAKGNDVFVIADGTQMPLQPPFVSQDEQNLHTVYCAAKELVLAKNIDSMSLLSSTGNYIFYRERI